MGLITGRQSSDAGHDSSLLCGNALRLRVMGGLSSGSTILYPSELVLKMLLPLVPVVSDSAAGFAQTCDCNVKNSGSRDAKLVLPSGISCTGAEQKLRLSKDSVLELENKPLIFSKPSGNEADRSWEVSTVLPRPIGESGTELPLFRCLFLSPLGDSCR